MMAMMMVMAMMMMMMTMVMMMMMMMMMTMMATMMMTMMMLIRLLLMMMMIVIIIIMTLTVVMIMMLMVAIAVVVVVVVDTVMLNIMVTRITRCCAKFRHPLWAGSIVEILVLCFVSVKKNSSRAAQYTEAGTVVQRLGCIYYKKLESTVVPAVII